MLKLVMQALPQPPPPPPQVFPVGLAALLTAIDIIPMAHTPIHLSLFLRLSIYDHAGPPSASSDPPPLRYCPSAWPHS